MMSFAVRARSEALRGARSDIVSQADEPGSAPPPTAKVGSGMSGNERTSSGGKGDAYHGRHDAAAGGAALTQGSGVTGERDRDPAGRPRQTRPRDALGRPLPYGVTGVEPVSEEPLPPAETLDAARSLVHEGRPFAAHEVLEARWKAGPSEERDLWQGLAQICVGLTHAARGNSVGAGRLVERGVARLEEYDAGTGPTYGLDLSAVVACARERVAPSP